jgi:hypothetical protein
VKRIVALLLFLAMQVPLMNQWGAVAYYRVNQDYISKNLCENRDKPMLDCNGQCYLAKQLKAAEEKEQKSNSERLEKMPEVVLSFQAIQPVFTARFTSSELVENHFSTQEFFPNAAAKGFFHPPQDRLI